MKLGLSPLEVEAAWRDWREFRSGHPKSKQTLTQCLMHFARKGRERTPVQLELPPATPRAPPRLAVDHFCPKHGRNRCAPACPALGPGPARASPTVTPLEEAPQAPDLVRARA